MKAYRPVVCSAFTAAAAMAFMVVPTQSAADVINLNERLTNPSFEAGLFDGCPAGWSCTNFSVTDPLAAQYPDPNGLVSPAIVPDGDSAAYTPVTGSGGILSQNLVAEQYKAGNSYVLDFWLGNPLGGAFPNRIDIRLIAGTHDSSQSNTLCDTPGRNATLVSGALTANDNGTQCLFSLTTSNWLPGDGDWRQYTLTFNTSVDVVGNIGIRFQVFGTAAENGTRVHLDLPDPRRPVDPTPVPEPATLALLVAGLAGLGARRR